MAKKQIKTWEREKGLLLLGDVDTSEYVEEEDFAQLALAGSVGVNFDDREKFLKDNGYEVNRDTLIDSSLSATK